METRKIYTTRNYYKFKYLEGNRNVNPIHYERIKKSISENSLFSIIVVNENFEIIDGQHRFEVCKELGLPINYVVCKGYGLKEVQMLNQNTKTWSGTDFLEAYCKIGNQDYIQFRDFMKRYDLGQNACLAIFAGIESSVDANKIKEFNNGKFKIYNYLKAVDIADKIISVSRFYTGAKRRTFIFALLSVLKNPEFNFNQFIHKLSYQSSELVDCVSKKDYISIIEKIYNYHSSNKINLRY